MFNKDEYKEVRSFDFSDIVIHALYGLLITFAMLLLAPGDAAILDKIIRSPLVILLNFIPIFLLGILLQGIFGRRSVSLIINSIFYLVIFTVNRTKVIYRNAPLRISDLRLVLEAVNMSKNSFAPDVYGLVVCIIGLIFLILLALVFKSEKLRIKDRLIAIVTVILSSLLLFNFVYTKDSLYYKLPLKGNSFNLIDQFNSKGFNYTFLFYLEKSFVKAPEGYSEKEIKERDVLDQSENIEAIKNMERPNIIWIMGEAFTDLSQDPHFTFVPENDPNKNLKMLQKNSIMHGRIVTPSFGGGTGDTEFDVLTGTLTINCAPDESFAFNAIKRDVGSMPNLLKSIGYKTMAFHPGYAWFYGRQNVYPKLGLDDNFFLEDIENPINKGDYLSEEQFTEIYINRFLEAIKNSDDPVFSYAVDIQNHGPYFYDKYGENLPYECSVNLSEEAANNFGSYFLGVKDMDNMLGAVYKMMNEIDEPTIMVFYGDHLPGLGSDPSAFDEIGIKLSHENLEKEIEFYSTPYVILANEKGRALMNRDNVEVRDGNAVSANYLSSMVLDMLNYNKVDNFFIYNSEVRKRIPIISRNFIFDGVNTYPRNDAKGDTKAYYDDYRRYEYYRINK
ncbi:LTA synthase family protein [Peptoniphilus phoceensis]|uniref:LTA synthase family protein n=1 Tax=Peptoniphilus phoceensis TaxID=1720298 RepID=UPI000780FD72|nr:LTA synthase family protein [Peptoniphilus phoceensis]